MAERSAIEWTDSTWNPWIGCTKVSPGCDNCYAERQDAFRHWTPAGWGAGQPRKRTQTWGDPEKWNARHFFECDACRWRGEHTNPIRGCPQCQRALGPARRRVFCSSLADVFDNEVPIEWVVDLLDLVRRTPNLDWLLLTKRIGNVLKRLHEARDHLALQPADLLLRGLQQWVEDWLEADHPDNVWLGATIVNQEEADRDIPKLLATPARVRFLSMEPLLGPVDVRRFVRASTSSIDYAQRVGHRNIGAADRLDWVITGGESGPKARPSHPDWFRSLRDQCAAAGVPFLFKQVGEAVPVETDVDTDHGHTVYPLDESIVLPGDRYKLHTAPSSQYFVRAPRKAAGRLLDGVEHNGFPEVTP